jgi:molybdenum cofactor cytidylyltransferase
MQAPPSENAFSLGVVILAAGRSVRMGRPKLLLPWAGTSILGHLLDHWRRLRATQIAVVCAPANPDVLAELARLNLPTGDIIKNPDPDQGMFSSIKCAANWQRWNATLTHWALVLGDQPHLRQSTLQAALDLAAAQPQKVVQPARAGHRRHPVLLPRSEFIRLAKSSDSNLNQFLHGCSITVFESDDPGLDLDIDRPEDYEKALRLAST